MNPFDANIIAAAKPKLAALCDCKEGAWPMYHTHPRRWWQFRPRRECLGWLTVSKGSGRTQILWTTGKDSHSLLAPPAWSIDIAAGGYLLFFFESEVSLWLKWSHSAGGKPGALARALGKADIAHTHLCQRPALEPGQIIDTDALH